MRFVISLKVKVMMSTIQKIFKLLLVVAAVSSFWALGFLYYQLDLKIDALEKRIFLQGLTGETLTAAKVEEMIDQKIKAIDFPVATPSTTTIIQKVTAPAPTAAGPRG